jgi:hypothetical protein
VRYRAGLRMSYVMTRGVLSLLQMPMRVGEFLQIECGLYGVFPDGKCSTESAERFDLQVCEDSIFESYSLAGCMTSKLEIACGFTIVPSTRGLLPRGYTRVVCGWFSCFTTRI